MGVVFKLPYTPQQIWNMKTLARLKELWKTNIIGSYVEVKDIISNDYVPSGSDGEGEKNGVPTSNDIEKIIAGTYEHHDVEIDEYGIPFEEVPTEDEIDAIINGTYIPTVETDDDDFVIDDDDVYYDDEGYVDEQDILDIINGNYN